MCSAAMVHARPGRAKPAAGAPRDISSGRRVDANLLQAEPAIEQQETSPATVNTGPDSRRTGVDLPASERGAPIAAERSGRPLPRRKCDGCTVPPRRAGLHRSPPRVSIARDFNTSGRSTELTGRQRQCRRTLHGVHGFPSDVRRDSPRRASGGTEPSHSGRRGGG